MHGHNLRRAGRVHEAIAEFEAADRLHREYFKREQMPAEYDWHFEHNLDLLATSLQYVGQMKRAEALLKAAFALPPNLVVQVYNKREWPAFLRARGRHQEAEAAARHADRATRIPSIQATGHIEAGYALLAAGRWGDARHASNTALKTAAHRARRRRSPPTRCWRCRASFVCGPPMREKGRAMLDEVAKRVRAAPGPGRAGAQALFTLEAMARAARAVGDWELAGRWRGR